MKKLNIIFALVFVSCYTGAQVPFFQNYFLQRKSEPVQVNTIFQDSKGYMWYGTNKGLFKYDGIKQKRFSLADSLPDENVTALTEDKHGRMWIGHKTGEISYVEKETITKFTTEEGSAAAEVSDMLFDRNGNLWFSTLGDGLYYYKKNRLYRLDESDNIPDIYIYDIEEATDGTIMAGTDGGVALCTVSDKKVTVRVANYDKGLPDNIIKKIVHGFGGAAWIATEDAGLISYNFTTGKYTTLISEWKYGPISDFIFKGNQVWIACYQQGIVVYDRRTNKARKYDAETGDGFTQVNTLTSDSEGNIWAGSMTGLLRINDEIERIEEFDGNKKVSISAVVRDREGNIWYSTDEGLFKRSNDFFGKPVIENILAHSAFQKNKIISLYIDHEGFVWAGSYGQGVLRINPTDYSMQCINSKLRDGNILNITGDGQYVWLATLGGATRISVTGDLMLIKNYSRDDGLNSEYIYQVFVDHEGRVWFGTDGKGVNMLDHSGFHHYTSGLNSKVVYGFAEDDQHTIWANVQGEGLCRFDGKNFQPFEKTRLHDNNINCLTTDEEGNLVIMHDLGIEVYDVKNNRIKFMGEQAGVRNKRPSLNAVMRDKGIVLFGTDEGIVIYTGRATANFSIPQPYIDGLKVVDEKMELSANAEFKHDQNDISINYLGFWYQNAENLFYQYKLENYDRSWISSRNRSVTYSSLPPGDYIFRIKASDSEDFSDVKETSYRFTINTPYWQTIWFYLLITNVLGLAIFGFIKYRERKLQKDKRVLEQKNDELKKINMELDRFVYSVSHDLRAPLLSMQGIVDITASETEDETVVEHMNMISGSITRLDSFIAEILDYSRNARTDVRKHVVDFKGILEGITTDLKHMSNEKSVDIQVEVKDNGAFYSDGERLKVIMNNLISNAIRYADPKAEKPFVKLHIDANDSLAMIVVEDNGIGIPQDYHQKVFEMFSRVSSTSTGSGLGLYIVKETIDKLSGEIDLKSAPGKGTKLTLKIPNLFYQ